MASILTPIQEISLRAIATTPLAHHFYFTGGTALSHYYLQHRYSEDLDFFTESEFNSQDITPYLKQLKPTIGYKEIGYQQSFNRNMYQLRFQSDPPLKVEFTYFPFPQIDPSQIKDDLHVDSLIDIATNKLFTIAQNPRGRDFYDLYHIIQSSNYSLEDLRRKAKIKFDWHIDPLELASQLYRVDEFIDEPILTHKANRHQIDQYFKLEANKLKTNIILK
jgi:predicted nucleotidyltransferase component of viral defense system